MYALYVQTCKHSLSGEDGAQPPAGPPPNSPNASYRIWRKPCPSGRRRRGWNGFAMIRAVRRKYYLHFARVTLANRPNDTRRRVENPNPLVTSLNRNV